MKIKTALKSRTVWCGIIAATIAALKLLWPDNPALDEVLSNKEQIGSNLVLIAQGLLGAGAIFYRINAKDRD